MFTNQVCVYLKKLIYIVNDDIVANIYDIQSAIYNTISVHMVDKKMINIIIINV